MDFSQTEEQLMLTASVDKFIAQSYSFEQRRGYCEAGSGLNRDVWQQFAELGWLMLPFSEEDGGIGGGAGELMPLMRAFGRGMVVEPYLATVVLAGGMIAALDAGERKRELLACVYSGDLQLALAFHEPNGGYGLSRVSTTAQRENDGYILNGHKAVVLNAAAADSLLVIARTAGDINAPYGISCFLVDPAFAGVTIESYVTIDGCRAGEVIFDNVPVPAASLIGTEGTALDSLQCVIDLAAFCVCADAVGAMEVMVQQTVEYTKTRQQFGVSLSSFQALQHRMADMFIEWQQAKSILMMAAQALDANNRKAPIAVSAAKSRIGKAARHISQEAVQLHGGIGMTDELDVGHLFKRLTAMQPLFGDSDYHTRRFAEGL